MAYSRQVSELIELDTVGFLEGTVKWRKHDKLLPDEIDARRAAAPRPLGKCVCVRLAALRCAARPAAFVPRVTAKGVAQIPSQPRESSRKRVV